MPDPTKQEPFPRPTSVGVEAPRVVETGVESNIEFNPPPEMPLPEPSPVVQGYIQTATQHRPLTTPERTAGIVDSHYFSTIHSIDQVSLEQSNQNLNNSGGGFSLPDVLSAVFAEKPKRIVDAARVFWNMFTRQKEREASSHA